MARGLHSDIKTELAKDNIVFSDVVELFLPTGTQRLTNAPFDITTTTRLQSNSRVESLRPNEGNQLYHRRGGYTSSCILCSVLSFDGQL